MRFLIGLIGTIMLAAVIVNGAHVRDPRRVGGNNSRNNAYGNSNKFSSPSKSSYSPSKSAYSSNLASKNSGADQVVRNDQKMNNDGSYHYEYETSNGISGNEQGVGGVSVQGTSSYISPEGVEVKTTYVADETGYHPVGEHIPQIPDYILRSLEYIRTHPYTERAEKHGGASSSSSRNGGSVSVPSRSFSPPKLSTPHRSASTAGAFKRPSNSRNQYNSRG